MYNYPNKNNLCLYFIQAGVTNDNTTSCQAHYVCEANHQLSRFGSIGKIIAHLLTNVVTGAFINRHPQSINKTIDAATRGRRGISCSANDNCI